MKAKENKIVPDTSVIISGVLSDLIEKNEIKGEIIIPEFVIEELRAQASRGRGDKEYQVFPERKEHNNC